MIQSLTPEQAKELIAQGNLDVVDVREPREFSTGHIPKARLIPLDRLKARPAEELHGDNVLFVCAKGMRSLSAAKVAEKLGLQHLYNLAGGTAGWASAGLPLERG